MRVTALGRIGVPARVRTVPGAPVLATVAVWALGALVFFREQWTSGFATLMGNEGDTRFATYVCEHWFQVFHGQASWLDPAYVYPVKGLLGWSDTFLLYEVFYAPLRLLGAGPFLALQLTDILLSLVGFCSFVALVRAAFAPPFPVAWAAGLAFAFSNALWLHSGAYQHSGLYVTALAAFLGVRSGQAARGGRRVASVVLAVTAGMVAGLLLYSTYYVSYFSFLTLAVFLAVLGAMHPARAWAWVRDAAPDLWPALAGGLLAFAVSLVPFALTYLPARRDSPGTTYADVMLYAPRLRDLFDFGRGNVFWSAAVHRALPQIDLGASELNWATTPLLMLAALAGGGLCARWARQDRNARTTADGPSTTGRSSAARMGAAMAVTAVVAAVIPLHTRLITPWAVLHHLPGAGAMRAIDRIELVAGFAAILTVTAAAGEVWRRRDRRSPRSRLSAVLIAAVVGVIVVEQLNTTPSSALDRRQQDQLLSSASRAPTPCREFYVVDSARALLWFQAQIDAMLISQRIHLPTINGYPSVNPMGWALGDIDSPDYLSAVRSWASDRHLLGGLCRLDLGTMQWQAPPTV